MKGHLKKYYYFEDEVENSSSDIPYEFLTFIIFYLNEKK